MKDFIRGGFWEGNRVRGREMGREGEREEGRGDFFYVEFN